MSDVPQLSYAVKPKWHQRRSARRWLLVLCVIVVVTTSIAYGWRWYPRARTLWDQRKLLNFDWPEGQTFSECSFEEADPVFSSGQLYEPRIMIHGRRSPNRPSRLVLVHAGFFTRWQHQKWPDSQRQSSDITAIVLETATWTSPGRAAGYGKLGNGYLMSVPIGQLSFSAGQPDPDDESHFTIKYATSDGSGTIDGWLMPDDSVKFQVRDGPAAVVLQ